jgi:hypothetical protein
MNLNAVPVLADSKYKIEPYNIVEIERGESHGLIEQIARARESTRNSDRTVGIQSDSRGGVQNS